MSPKMLFTIGAGSAVAIKVCIQATGALQGYMQTDAREEERKSEKDEEGKSWNRVIIDSFKLCIEQWRSDSFPFWMES